MSRTYYRLTSITQDTSDDLHTTESPTYILVLLHDTNKETQAGGNGPSCLLSWGTSIREGAVPVAEEVDPSARNSADVATRSKRRLPGDHAEPALGDVGWSVGVPVRVACLFSVRSYARIISCAL